MLWQSCGLAHVCKGKAVIRNRGQQVNEMEIGTAAALNWQSRAVLLITAPAAAVYAALQVVHGASLRLTVTGALFSVLFAALVYAARAATPGAALLGALLAFCYALTPSYPHSPLWALVAMLVLTLGASRVGRERKQVQGTAEEKHGRTASQVAANLGVGALAGAAINSYGGVLAHAALLAALAEATADTLGSELGQLVKTHPRMLLTGRQVPPGTDGAVSIPGTLAGLAGALLLCAVARWAFTLPGWAVGLGFDGAVFGFLFDSVLGQLVERRGGLNNDAVNFLSTLAAACFALLAGQML